MNLGTAMAFHMCGPEVLAWEKHFLIKHWWEVLGFTDFQNRLKLSLNCRPCVLGCLINARHGWTGYNMCQCTHKRWSPKWGEKREKTCCDHNFPRSIGFTHAACSSSFLAPKFLWRRSSVFKISPSIKTCRKRQTYQWYLGRLIV